MLIKYVYPDPKINGAKPLELKSSQATDLLIGFLCLTTLDQLAYFFRIILGSNQNLLLHICTRTHRGKRCMFIARLSLVGSADFTLNTLR